MTHTRDELLGAVRTGWGRTEPWLDRYTISLDDPDAQTIAADDGVRKLIIRDFLIRQLEQTSDETYPECAEYLAGRVEFYVGEVKKVLRHLDRELGADVAGGKKPAKSPAKNPTSPASKPQRHRRAPKRKRGITRCDLVTSATKGWYEYPADEREAVKAAMKALVQLVKAREALVYVEPCDFSALEAGGVEENDASAEVVRALAVCDDTSEVEGPGLLARVLRLIPGLPKRQRQAVEDELSKCLEELKEDGYDIHELIKNLGIPPRTTPWVPPQTSEERHRLAEALSQARQSLGETTRHIL